MIDIFHRANYVPNIMFESDFCLIKDDFIKVAVIDSDDLGDAWNLTQHSDVYLTERENVDALVEGVFCRSSSVGDVFSVNGMLYLVLPVGYKIFSWGDEVTLRPSFFK